MAIKDFRSVAAAAALALGSVVGTGAQAQDSTLLFTGIDARQDNIYGYIGGRHHLNGNLATSGFLLRAFALYGDYDYRSSAVGRVDGDVVAFDAMAGYQLALTGVLLRGYVGLDFEDHDLSPNNPFDSNRGSDFGVKFQGEVETDFSSPFYGSLIGSYGTAKDRYWVRARGGYAFFSGVTIGPEGLVTGNEETDEQRIGAFVMLTNLGQFGVSASGGYSNTENHRGGGSAYGTVELTLRF